MANFKEEVNDVEDEITKEVTVEEEHLEEDGDLIKEVEDLTVKLARLQADFVNFKKRSEKEKESSIAYGVESFVCELLPIMDNFQRALDSEMDKESGFFKGVEMILNQLKTLLVNKGIEEIDDLGNDFDPNIHNAISMEESEEFEAGKVISVLQKGYKFKDKIIRPSMVIVSK
jgi:molecular chaperone GrpE